MISRIAAFLTLAFFISAPTALSAGEKTAIVSIAMDDGGIPFILDNKGDVWAFKHPDTLKDPIRISNLHHIKKIAPFIALAADGKVYNWTIKSWEKENEQSSPILTYSEPILVEGLSNISDIASGNVKFIAIRDNYVFEWQVKTEPFIALIPQPELTIKLPAAPLPEISIAMLRDSLAILFQDKYVISWGVNTFGMADKYSPEVPRKVTLPEDTQKIVMGDYNSLVAITKTGHALFWKACYSKESGKCVNGIQYPLNDIIDMAFVRDAPGVFLKKDGSIWIGYPPAIDSEGSVKYQHLENGQITKQYAVRKFL